MELVPWRPFGELGSFRGEMDKLWDRFFTLTLFSTLSISSILSLLSSVNIYFSLKALDFTPHKHKVYFSSYTVQLVLSSI